MPYKDPKKEKISARKRNKTYRAKPNYKNLMRNCHLKNKYGISLEVYQALFDSQNGLCATCGKPETGINQYGMKTLSVDHNHDTGKIRGLLCRNCNSTLGFLKENVDTLNNLILYLKKHNHG